MGRPFESLGLYALIVVGIIFVVVSAMTFLAAYWLWQPRKDGAVLGLILLGLIAPCIRLKPYARRAVSISARQHFSKNKKTDWLTG